MAKIKGKWRWNEVVICTLDLWEEHNNYYVNFESNGESFTGLTFSYTTLTHYLYYQGRDPVLVGQGEDYDVREYSINEAYREMNFVEEQEIDDVIYEFIFANASEVSPIAEKLVEVANNVPKVFAAGKQQGHGEGYDAGFEAGKEFGGYNEGYDEGYGKGYSQSESDFWDIVQQGGRRTSYDVAFCWWDCEYLHPKYKVVPTSSVNAARNMIYRCAKLKKIEAAYFDLSKVPNTTTTYDTLGYLFGLCDELEEIEDVGLQAPLFLNYFCYSDKKLKKIAVIRIAEETQVNNMLYYCPELEYVRIEGVIGQSGIDLKYSTKLSKESIESIVNHLSDSATGKTLTLSKAAVNKAFETSEGANDGVSSQEWDSLEGLKTNWEITLL